MKYFIISFLVLSLFNFSHIYSQAKIDDTPKDSISSFQNKMTLWETFNYDGASTFGGIKHTFTQPFKWKGKDWVKFGGVVAGAALVYLIDEPANTFFTKQEEDIPHFIKEVGFRFGKPVVNYGITAGVYAFGLFTKNEKVRKTGVLLIASATAGGIIQTISKTLVGRARPTTGEGKGSFHFYSNEPEYHSFPSGHTILSFTTAYAISKQFTNPYIKVGFYAVGLISPVSRLWAGAHWLTDVSLGILLSVVIVDGVDNFLNKNERYVYNPNKLRIKWDITFGPGQIGFVGTF